MVRGGCIFPLHFVSSRTLSHMTTNILFSRPTEIHPETCENCYCAFLCSFSSTHVPHIPFNFPPNFFPPRTLTLITLDLPILEAAGNNLNQFGNHLKQQIFDRNTKEFQQIIGFHASYDFNTKLSACCQIYRRPKIVSPQL